MCILVGCALTRAGIGPAGDVRGMFGLLVIDVLDEDLRVFNLEGG